MKQICDHYYTESKKSIVVVIYSIEMIDFYDNIEYKGAFYSITKEQYEIT